MRFSIITPSFRSGNWLRLCISSVADQGKGVLREHIVQDAGSDDGTLDWLLSDPRVTAVVEKDRGMYDAVNRGFRKSSGEFLAYLNCDEQYLPGALEKVARFFDSHPEADVVLADTLVVRPDGAYLCYRRSITPLAVQTQVGSTLSFFTASLFLRRRAVFDHGLFFDENYRDMGDAVWALKLIASGRKAMVMRQFTSVFAETGENMNMKPNAIREKAELAASAPLWARLAKPLADQQHRIRRWLGGAYRCDPHDYAIYTKDSLSVRRVFHVDRPVSRWNRVPLNKQA